MNKIITQAHHGRLSPLGGIDRLELPENSLRRVAIHCDGALKTEQNLHSGLGFSGGVSELAINTLRGHSRHSRSRVLTHTSSQQLQQEDSASRLSSVDQAGLLSFPATGARIWLQAASEKQLAIQWNIPSNVKRNCADLLDGHKLDFVLRLYRECINSEWKAAHRTLEFPLDIKRRRGFINLEKSGGSFTAELGVKLEGGRYVFLARSSRIEMPLPSHSTEMDKLTFIRATQSNIYLPQVPGIFTAPLVKPVIAVERDQPWLDLRSESEVAAIYTDFMSQGRKALRWRDKPRRQPLQKRQEQFAARQQQRTLEIVENTPSARTIKDEFTIERLDKPVRKSTPRRDVIALNNPPALLTEKFNSHLSFADAEPFGLLNYFCRRENLMPVEHFSREELATLQKENGKRRIIKVKSNRHLSKLLKDTSLSGKAEIILRGRVKPGKKVRVGGLLIETEDDGSFCVACVIRNGKLQVPVEEVEAVYCE